MSLLIPGVRGLTIVKTVVQIAAYGIITWVYADRAGLGDEFREGVEALLKLPADLLGLTATPGGGQR